MTDRPWAPEHPVDEALARALVGEQFPELASLPVTRLGEGWDMDVWGFGGLAFRFPRRQIAVPLVTREISALAWLGPRLPVAIPRPLHIGKPSPAFPYAFYGHRLIPGTTADRLALSTEGRARLAAPLGRFLRALHSLDPVESEAHGLLFQPEFASPERQQARALPRLASLAGTPLEAPVREALSVLPPPNDEPHHVAHGDLYSRHVVVDHGELSGIIDWGDVRRGDRAPDLALIATFLPPEARAAFFEAYGAISPELWARARFYGLCRYGLALHVYALDLGDGGLAAEARRGLENALAQS